MRYTKPTGRSEVISRLRKIEGYNDKRFTTPVVHDCGEEQTECECVKPADNDQGTCMNCGCWISYKSKA